MKGNIFHRDLKPSKKLLTAFEAHTRFCVPNRVPNTQQPCEIGPQHVSSLRRDVPHGLPDARLTAVIPGAQKLPCYTGLMTIAIGSLHDMSDEHLLRQVAYLVRQERHATAKLIRFADRARCAQALSA